MQKLKKVRSGDNAWKIFVQGQFNDILIMAIGNSVSSMSCTRRRPSKSQVKHSIISARTAWWGKVRNMGLKPFRKKKDYCHFQDECNYHHVPLTWQKKVAAEQLSCHLEKPMGACGCGDSMAWVCPKSHGFLGFDRLSATGAQSHIMHG